MVKGDGGSVRGPYLKADRGSSSRPGPRFAGLNQGTPNAPAAVVLGDYQAFHLGGGLLHKAAGCYKTNHFAGAESNQSTTV
jgi:hypothetical protein